MTHVFSPDDTAGSIRERLDLRPHPEGGWFRETWRGPAGASDGRGVGTAILFLLEAGERSRSHRVDATELWLFHVGSPLRLLTAAGEAEAAVEHRLGPDPLAGHHVQHVIGPHEWQSAHADEGWCLVSCVVVPAFEFSGFELADEGWHPGAAGSA